MIKEKMLEFLVISEVFKTTQEVPEELDCAYDNMYVRYKKLRDEFIQEFNYNRAPNNNPVKDTKDCEA